MMKSKSADLSYYELQSCPIWLMLAIIGLILVSLIPSLFVGGSHRNPSAGILAVIITALVFTSNMLYMRTKIAANKLKISFGFLVPYYFRTISLAEIKSTKVVIFSPLTEYGGWGIKANAKGGRCLTMQGNTGVHLTFRDSKTLLIGSKSPELLASAIKDAAH
jgi:hypothetical protein